jgi:hypothetical protein
MGTSYLGNPKLKSANVPVEFSEEQLTEYIKCLFKGNGISCRST